MPPLRSGCNSGVVILISRAMVVSFELECLLAKYNNTNYCLSFVVFRGRHKFPNASGLGQDNFLTIRVSHRPVEVECFQRGDDTQRL